MNDPVTQVVEAVRVHVENAHEIGAHAAQAAPAAPRHHLKTTAQTVVLESSSDIEPLLGEDPTRTEALILPGSGAFVICDTSAQASAVAKGSASSGAAYSSSTSAPVPVKGTNKMFAVGASGDTYPVYVYLLVTTKVSD